MQTLTLVRCDIDFDCVINTYACDFVADCDGSSIWGDTTDKKVRVEGITIVHNVYDGEVYTQVNVAHDSTWDIYTDGGFERAISEAIGFEVRFTEQGMQEDELASMEA